MDCKFLVGAIAALASLALAGHAADAWTLQTEEGGNVLFPAGGAKFQPMQRRADDSFKRYVANVEADSSDSSRPRLRWTFPTRVEGEKNVIVMSLDAESWAGGRCVSDVKAHLALALGSGDFRVYALDTSGERVRDVHCRMHKGRLRFDADVAADPECATFLYEIVRR